MSENLNVIIIDKEENSRNIIKNYLSSFNNIEICAEFFDFELGFDFLRKAGKCIAFIDISENFEKALNLIKKLKDLNKEAHVVALSNKTSTDTIIKVMRAGAKEFVTKPVMESEFKEVINNLTQELNCVEPVQNCKIISTFSNKGRYRQNLHCC